MRQLVYVSAATWDLGEQDIKGILKSARHHNPKHDVTGMLLFIDLGFFQILEGPSSGVETIYSRIKLDKRHRQVRVLVDEDGDKRLFAQWSMGYDRPDPKLIADGDMFLATRNAIEAKVPLNQAIATARLVRNFYAVNAVREFD